MVPDLHETPNKTTSCDCGLTRILSFFVPSVARGFCRRWLFTIRKPTTLTMALSRLFVKKVVPSRRRALCWQHCQYQRCLISFFYKFWGSEKGSTPQNATGCRLGGGEMCPKILKKKHKKARWAQPKTQLFHSIPGAISISHVLDLGYHELQLRSLGSPKWVCSPMIDQSERAFRILCRRPLGFCYQDGKFVEVLNTHEWTHICSVWMYVLFLFDIASIQFGPFPRKAWF